MVVAYGELFLNLSEAVDTADHKIIQLKLKILGMKESSILWVQGYSEKRTQCTQEDGTLSDSKHLNSDIPQGSILPSLLCVL